MRVGVIRAIAVGLVLGWTGTGVAEEGASLLDAEALDVIVAGTATSLASAEGIAAGNEAAFVDVEAESMSVTDGKISKSSSTAIARAFGLGNGAEARTAGSASGSGNAGVMGKVVTVRGITPYGKMSVTVAHVTAVGIEP